VLSDCPFCAIISGEAPATVVRHWPDAIAIKPILPVTPGHTLIIPVEHVANACADPRVASIAMHRAAEYARGEGPLNIITSVGREATQTVTHLHIHVVPRHDGDGLALPWTGQESSDRRHD
jgi:histidine triad (HIT) family protein